MEGNAKSFSQKLRDSGFRFQDKGQTLVELLLALGIFAFIMTAVFALVFGGLTTGLRTEEQDYATMYAQEGLDAARSIRDTDWNAFAQNGTHGVVNPGTGWSWNGTTFNEITYGARKFTREIFVEDVYRDSNNNIFTGESFANFDFSASGDYQCEGGSCPSANLKIADSAAKLNGSVRLDNTVAPKELTPYITANTKALYHFNLNEGKELALGDLGGVPDANLKGLWHLNESSGAQANDLSGNGNNGIFGPALVANSGFETGTGVDAASWTESVSADRVSDRAFAGTYSMKFVTPTTAQAAAQTVNVTGSTTYALSAWVYNSLTAGSAYLDLSDIAEECSAASTRGNNAWQFVSCTFTTASTRTSVTVRMVTDSLTGNTGSIWFDEVSLNRAPLPTWSTAGKFSNALSFDGTDDYVSVNPAILNGAGAATVEAWIKLNAYAATSQSPIVVDRTATQSDFQFIVLPNDNNPNKLMFSVWTSGGGGNAVSTANIPLNTWTHIVGVYDGSQVRTYINGVLDGTSGSVLGTITANSNDLRIGGDAFGSPEFNGSIDEVAVYNTALTLTQIKEHYERGAGKNAVFLTNSAPALSNSGGGTWTYRAPVTINNSGSALSDYQIKVNLTNFYLGSSDIRFTKSDGATELPYWIETWNPAGTSIVWVKVTGANGIPAGTSTIYMYYGNPSAASASDITSTFIFGDDFSSGTLNTTKWPGNTFGSNLTISGGVLSVKSTGAAWQGLNSSYSSIPSNTTITEMRYKTAGTQAMHLYYEETNNRFAIHPYYLVTAGPRIQYRVSAGAYTNGAQYATTTANTWYIHRMERQSPTVFRACTYDVNYNLLGSCSSQTQSGWGTISFSFNIAEYTNMLSDFDWVRVRQYASVEPTVTVNINNGTILGSTSAVSQTGLNEALFFDWTDDYVSLSNPSSFNFSAPASFEGWIKPLLDGAQYVFSVSDPTTSSNYQTICIGNGCTGSYVNELVTIMRRINGGSSETTVYTTDTRTELFDNSWHHLAVVFTGSATQIYIDGNPKTVSGTNNGAFGGMTVVADASIGSRITSNIRLGYFNGSIDEVAIWNKALTQQEIWDHIGANLGYTANTYATVKYNPNPPGTPNKDTLYIDKFKEFIEAATIPSGTSIDYQLSTDNCVTMKYWNGDSWENAGGWNDIRTINRYFDQLNPIAQTTLVSTIDSSQTSGIILSSSTGFPPLGGKIRIGNEEITYDWILANELMDVTRGMGAAQHNSGASIFNVDPKLCLAARLNTTDANQTPVLDNVEIKYSQNRDSGITWPADAHTKKVTSRVKWPSGFSFQDVSLAEYLTDWMYGFLTRTTYNDFYCPLCSAENPQYLGSANPDDTVAGGITLGPSFSAVRYDSLDYDIGDSQKLLKLVWNEDTPGTTAIHFYLCTSQNSGLCGDYMGPGGTNFGTDYFSNSSSGCSKSGTTVTCLIPSNIGIGDGVNDRYVTFVFDLLPDASLTQAPTLYDMTVQYKGIY